MTFTTGRNGQGSFNELSGDMSHPLLCPLLLLLPLLEVGSISAPSATNGDPQQLPAEGFGERVARSLSGASSASSLDPKTDGAINHELSRVCLDPAVKARIRSCIYRELKRNGRTREQSQRALHERSKVGNHVFPPSALPLPYRPRPLPPVPFSTSYSLQFKRFLS